VHGKLPEANNGTGPAYFSQGKTWSSAIRFKLLAIKCTGSDIIYDKRKT
jgi:hypothetical protein